MSTAEGHQSNEVQQEEALRHQIRTTIDNPEPSLVYLASLWEGRHEPPENRVLITGLTLPRVRQFYELVQEELREVKAKGNVEFSDRLEQSLATEEGKQSTFDHEIAHIEKADELGVDLSKSQLELFFLTDGFGLQLVHQFVPPSDIDPMVRLKVALAPEEPSPPDYQVVKKTITENDELFNGNQQLLEEASALYSERTGKSLVSLLEGKE